ncbi:hypothetical protein Tco_0847056 [Tanacetum coccineum]
MSKSAWTEKDQIDNFLKERRLMRSLEKVVGGRLYEENLRLLQRTICFHHMMFSSFRFNTTAGNPVKEILLKLNLPDHRSILMDSKEYIKMVMENTCILHVPVTTFVEPPLLSATTLPPPPTPLITHLQQTPVPTPPTIPSSSLQDLPNFGSLFGFNQRLKTLENNFLEFNQTNQFAVAVSSIPSIVDAYLDNKMHKARVCSCRGANAHCQRFEKTRTSGVQIGFTDDQPNEETSQLPDCFLKPTKPPTPDRDWSKTLPDAHGPVQPWLSSLAQMEDPRESIDTPLEFPAFVMNRLKVDTLTPELLAGPTFELMKGSCKSLVKLEYFFEEVYKATTDQLDWNNPEDNDKLYKFKEGDFNRLRIQDIEDILLLLVQGKLTNLTIEECLAFNVLLRMFTRSVVIQRRVEDLQLGVENNQKKLNLTKPDTYRPYLKRKEAYTAYSNPRGFIYQNKDKKNRLMRIDELHKFSNGTLNDVQTALNDHLKGIRMEYLPQTILRQSDKDKAGEMIQSIDKQLKTRRIMQSLEKFFGGRPYEGDF